MNSKQNLIWEYLVSNAQGIHNHVKVRDVANAIGEPPSGTNDDKVRKLMADMVNNHLKLIGTFDDGVFIITSEDECEIAANFVNRKNRADNVRENWKNSK